jgi:hypothetical protein
MGLSLTCDRCGATARVATRLSYQSVELSASTVRPALPSMGIVTPTEGRLVCESCMTSVSRFFNLQLASLDPALVASLIPPPPVVVPTVPAAPQEPTTAAAATAAPETTAPPTPTPTLPQS